MQDQMVDNDVGAPDQEEVEVDEKQTALEELNELFNDMNDFALALKELQKKAKEIKKRLDKEFKDLKKNAKPKRTRKPDAKPTSFKTNLAKISDEMRDYLSLDSNMIARTEVSKRLNERIRNDKLQDPKDRRMIKPDDKLRKLFSNDYVDGCKLDFFTMQKYIKHHYVKEQ
jgi:chromatin remodeling complex protein RSC6